MTRPAETVDVMRRRAKHRLVGAVLLVLAGVVGFPWVFDTQPRPNSADVQIDLPEKTKSTADKSTTEKSGKSVGSAVALPAALPAPAAPKSAPVGGPVSAAASLDPQEQLVAPSGAKASSKPTVKPEVKTDMKAVTKAPVKTEAKPESKPEIKATAPAQTQAPTQMPSDDGTRAKLLLEGNDGGSTVGASATAARYVIQVGAFADLTKAREARLKLERAGLKTYTHVAQTKDGERTRVRVGPFATKAEADKVAGKVKTLDLPAAILTL